MLLQLTSCGTERAARRRLLVVKPVEGQVENIMVLNGEKVDGEVSRSRVCFIYLLSECVCV